MIEKKDNKYLNRKLLIVSPIILLIFQICIFSAIMVKDRYLPKLANDIYVGTHFIIGRDNVEKYSINQIREVLNIDSMYIGYEYTQFVTRLNDSNLIFEQKICQVNPELGEKQVVINFGPDNQYEGLFMVLFIEETENKEIIKNLIWPERQLLSKYIDCLPEGYKRSLFNNL